MYQNIIIPLKTQWVSSQHDIIGLHSFTEPQNCWGKTRKQTESRRRSGKEGLDQTEDQQWTEEAHPESLFCSEEEGKSSQNNQDGGLNYMLGSKNGQNKDLLSEPNVWRGTLQIHLVRLRSYMTSCKEWKVPQEPLVKQMTVMEERRVVSSETWEHRRY